MHYLQNHQIGPPKGPGCLGLRVNIHIQILMLQIHLMNCCISGISIDSCQYCLVEQIASLVLGHEKQHGAD